MTSPPRSPPVPLSVNGSPSPVMSAPSARSAWSTVPMGRVRACGSPSNRISPLASAAAGGRNRITVPARPQSTSAGPRSSPGLTSQLPAGPSTTSTPSARSASTISVLSRLRSGACRTDGPSASAASSSRRLVIDLEPGTGTVERTGPLAVGADHC